MYTKEEIEKGFKAAGERMQRIEGDHSEFQKAIDSLISQVKLLKSVGANFSSDEGSNNFWPNKEMAKEFGLVVAKVCGIETKDMGTGTNADGGILVPEELGNWIIQKMGRYGKYRKNAQVVQLGSASQIVPQVTSDLTVYCPGEGGKITTSDMQFAGVHMQPRKFCCLAIINKELEEDSIVGLGEIVGISIARSMAKKEDLIGFLGDGTSTYFAMTGIIHELKSIAADPADIPGLVVGSGNAYAELTLGDFEKVAGVLPEDAEEGANWFMSKKFYYNVVHPLAVAAGVANMFDILSDRKSRYLMGYPVEFVSCMPSTEANSQVCAILGDLKLGAFLGERKGLEIERSDQRYFDTDQVGIRGLQRISIDPYGVGDTEEAGPIVGLITAAS